MTDTPKKAPAKASKSAAKKSTPAAAKKSTPTAAAKSTGTAESKTAAASHGKHVSHEEIAKLAHQYWSERGRGNGHHEEDWHRAEKELRSR